MNLTPIEEKSERRISVGLEKVAYSLKELSEITPMSEAFYRAEIIAGRLVAKSFGTRLCIMREDWLDYLNKQKNWIPRKQRKAARAEAA